MYLNLEKETLANTDYRRVVYTGKLQLVLMSLKPGEDIELEVHPDIDQFFRIERGTGEIRTGQNEENLYQVKDGYSVIIPHGTYHHVINTGNEDLKLYTIYSPAEHAPNRVDHTRPSNREENQKGFTQNRDADRIILEKLDDRDLFNLLQVNKYALSLADENFWRNRFLKKYPGIREYKPPSLGWKPYYLQTIYYLDKIKAKGFEYTHGDPKYIYEQINIKSVSRSPQQQKIYLQNGYEDLALYFANKMRREFLYPLYIKDSDEWKERKNVLENDF